MGCAAKVIVLDDVRASQQRQALRQQLHAHFARWLAEIEAACPESEPTLAQGSETTWRLRQKRHRWSGPDDCRAHSRRRTASRVLAVCNV
jgi:hypothetical protein